MTGNVAEARQYIAPRFARMEITEMNGKHSVPIQYAIVQRNKEMASFLVSNDCHKRLNRRNLAYYSAIHGYDGMARHFVSLGEGSYSDISRAKSDLVAQRARKRRTSATTALIGLGLLSMMMAGSSGSGDGSSRNPNGFTDDQMTQAMLKSPSNPAGY